MLLHIHAMQGLHALAVIASSSGKQPVPTTRLARHIGLCLSSTEIIVKHLKSNGLLRSHRGPGGGYQLERPCEQLSVWDVVACFPDQDRPAQSDQISPESEAAWALSVALDDTLRHYLQAYRLSDVLGKFPSGAPQNQECDTQRVAFNLKPLRPPSLPLAPSWVFDLAKFSRSAHA
jgi:Rrf2 family protein